MSPPLNDGYPAPPESLAVETASREALEKVQAEGLKRLARRTWEHVPFYRELWQRQGMAPEDIRGLEDLGKLPVVTKKDLEDSLKRHPPFGNYQGDFPSIRIQASSGTSGDPKPIFHTRRDWEIIASFWARRFHAQGISAGDRFQVVFTYSLFIAGFTATEGAMRLGALVIPAGSGAVTPSERQVRIAKEWGSTVLCGTPSYVLHLADVAERIGFDPRHDFKVRVTTHTSEALTEPMRRAIEDCWGVDCYDNFGSVETGAPTFECAEKNGYHINEDGYIFEVLDPSTYEPVPPGGEGVLVVTSLYREAAPMVRYNLEDISSFIAGACPCGRTFKRLSKIKGRSNEMIKIRGVAFYPSALEAVIEKRRELTREYLLVLDREGQRDRALLKVECRREEATPELKLKLERELKVATGVSIEAEMLRPGELAHSLKVEERVKAKRVWDRRR
jgi:phenylacetate-CoA ligase